MKTTNDYITILRNNMNPMLLKQIKRDGIYA